MASAIVGNTGHRTGKFKTGHRGGHRLYQAFFAKTGDPTPRVKLIIQYLRTLPRNHRSGAESWPECDGNLADLVTDYGFTGAYNTVKRFVQKLRGARQPEPSGIIITAPGEEAQVDYGTGPMVRDPQTGKYRRTRLFVMTLGFSRKSVRLLTFKSSSRIWAELHEAAFRRLGGCPRLIVLDYVSGNIIEILWPI